MLSHGIALDWGLRSTREFLDQAANLRESVFDIVWMSNNRFEQDVWVASTALSFSVTSAHVGTFIVDPYTQHPAMLAAAIGTLEQIAPKVPVLGLGAGGTGFREMGLGRPRIAARLETAVAVVKRLLSGETVTTHEEIVCEGVRLDFRPKRRCPVVIATRGDRVLEAAGRVADGAMISTYAEVATVERAMAIVRKAAVDVGRDPAGVVLLARVDVGRPSAEWEIRKSLAMSVVTSYPDDRFLRVAGVEMPRKLLEAAARKDIPTARGLAKSISDDALRRFAWVGDDRTVAAGAQALVDVGIDGVTVVPHGQTPDETLDCISMCARGLESVTRPSGTYESATRNARLWDPDDG